MINKIKDIKIGKLYLLKENPHKTIWQYWFAGVGVGEAPDEKLPIESSIPEEGIIISVLNIQEDNDNPWIYFDYENIRIRIPFNYFKNIVEVYKKPKPIKAKPRLSLINFT